MLLVQTSTCYPISDGELLEGSQQERSDSINSGGRKVSTGTQQQTPVQVGERGCALSTRHDRVMVMASPA